MVAKVAGGIIGLGLIGTGGVVFVKPEWFGINKEVPWTPLSEDSDYKSKSGDYNGKFGSNYKYYLVGATENQDWWNKIFDQLKEDSKSEDANQVPSDKFKHTDTDSKVTEGFSKTNDTTALNQICKKIYKEATTNIKQTVTGTDSGYKEADVWKYCSPLGEKLKTISDAGGEAYTTSGWIGNDTTNKTKLVSTTGNTKFWEIREKEFRGIGKYQKIEEAKDAFFNPDKGKSIKDLCEDAYKQTATTNSSDKAPSTTKAIKYCSINKE